MQFSLIALIATLTAAAMAMPMALHQVRSCDVANCVIALGPAAVGCTAAAVEVGANPLADAGCLAGALNSVVNVPAACSGCAADLGVTQAVSEAESAIGSIF